jgi:uncharacterized protein
MKIALAGYRGFIGSALKEHYKEADFVLLDREALYGPSEILGKRLEGCDIVMNFTGYPVSKRWNRSNKRKMYDSRILVTRNLLNAIDLLTLKPEKIVMASAIGIYRYNETHDEYDKNFGTGFLASLVIEWEKEMMRNELEKRLLLFRTGMVLGNKGGAFPRLAGFFKAGIGGVIGSGKQVYSFIHIQDAVDAIAHCIGEKEHGIFNLTSPFPVTNSQFSKTLASQYKKKLFLPVPSFILKLTMGKSSEIVLEGATVLPKRLTDIGFKFTFATIEEAIGNLIRKA